MEIINSEFAEQSLLWGGYVGKFIFELLLSMLPWSVLFCFFGFIIAIVVSIIIKKKKWLVRETKKWNLVVKLFYLAIFAAFTMSGCAVGGIYGVQRDVNSRIDDQLLPVLEKNMPTLHEYILSYTEDMEGEGSSGDIVKGILLTLYYQPKSDGYFEQKKADCINWVTLNFGKWVITAGVSAMIAWMIGRSGDDFGITGESITFTFDLIKRMDLSKVDSTIARITADAFQEKTNKFFGALYIKVFIFLFLVFAVICGESIYYHRYRKTEV